MSQPFEPGPGWREATDDERSGSSHRSTRMTVYGASNEVMRAKIVAAAYADNIWNENGGPVNGYVDLAKHYGVDA